MHQTIGREMVNCYCLTYTKEHTSLIAKAFAEQQIEERSLHLLILTENDFVTYHLVCLLRRWSSKKEQHKIGLTIFIEHYNREKEI